MTKVKTPEIWVIKHKETGKLWVAPSGKSSWRQQNHAKSAWATLCGYHYSSRGEVERVTSEYEVYPYSVTTYNGKVRWEFPKFSQQDTWEVVKLTTELEDRLSKAESLLKLCLGKVDSSTEQQILNYFEENTDDKL